MAVFFDQTHIQQILQAINIVDVVGNYVSLSPKGKEMIGLCPFHQDRRPSLNVSPSKQIFKCFACGAGGDAFKFLMLRENLTFPETVRFLAERAGVKLPEGQRELGQGIDRHELEAVNRWAAKFYRAQFDDEHTGLKARKYVQERGINEDIARQFGLGWAPAEWDNLSQAAQRAGLKMELLSALGLIMSRETGGFYDRFRQRLMFPVVDALGRVVAFGGRTLGDDPAKYMNSPESALFTKSRTLYGIRQAKDSIIKEHTAVVVEGYTDCMMAHQHGLTNVVATLGTALTDEHAGMLSRYADRIVLVFDSDEAGQKAAERAIEIFFAQQTEVQLARLPKGMDPCDFLRERGRGAFAELIEQATEALEYKWQATRSRLENEDTVNGRKRAVEEFLKLVAQSLNRSGVDAISRGFMLNHVTKLVEMPAQQVHARVSHLQNRGSQGWGAQQQQRPEMVAADSCVNAQREILEVLLNRPDLFKLVREAIAGPEEFKDELHRSIAQRLWDYYEKGGQGPLSEILGMCESTHLCNIITDMAVGGESRGNYENTLAGALGRLRRRKADQQRDAIRQIVGKAAEQYGEPTETAMLQDIQSRLRAEHGIREQDRVKI